MPAQANNTVRKLLGKEVCCAVEKALQEKAFSQEVRLLDSP